MKSRFEPLPVFLAAAVFLVLGPLFWLRIDAPALVRETRQYESTDLVRDIYPFLSYGFGRLRAGDLPLWNESQLCGTPYLANPRHGLFQPLNFWFYFFETPQALVLHAFASFALMGLFFFLFCRHMSLSPLSALLGGMAFAFGGAAACAAAEPGILNVMTWTPLLALGMRWASRSSGLTPAIISGMLTACVLLSGAVLPGLTVAGVLLLYMLGDAYRSSASRVDRQPPHVSPSYGRCFRNGVVICFVGTALAAVQWIPTAVWAVSLSNPLEALFPGLHFSPGPAGTSHLFYHLFRLRAGNAPVPGYMGMAALLAAPLGLYYGKHRREAMLAALIGGIAWVIAAITEYHHAGLLVAIASSLFIPAAFFFALLFSIAMDPMLAHRHSMRSPYFWTPLLCLLAMFMLLFYLAPSAARGRLIPVGCVMLLSLLVRRRWASMLAAALVALFLFIDLSTAGSHRRIHPVSRSTLEKPLSASEIRLLQRTQLDGRVYVLAPEAAWQIHPNMGMSEGFRMANGSGLPLTADQSVYYAAIVEDLTKEAGEALGDDVGGPTPAPRISRALPLLFPMAARAVLVSDHSDLASAGAATDPTLARTVLGHGALYVNAAALPRISWASSWRIVLDIETAVGLIRDLGVDLRQECLIAPDEPGRTYAARVVPETHANAPGGHATGIAPPRIVMQEDRAEYLRISVQSSQPGILLLADTYDAGWTARSNDEPVPILRANGLFRGIALPPGDHRVEFFYRPRSFYLGATVSMLAMTTLLLIGLSSAYAKMRSTHV